MPRRVARIQTGIAGVPLPSPRRQADRARRDAQEIAPSRDQMPSEFDRWRTRADAVRQDYPRPSRTTPARAPRSGR